LEEIKDKWNKFADIYSNFDPQTNTFFYQLAYLLHLQDATSIYDVGCGRGILLPYAMQLKHKEASYTAVDLSETMIELCKKSIDHFLQTIPKPVELS
jgi:cyclopropane fatty-acyl-phospholipid synthase-like methyltransferase